MYLKYAKWQADRQTDRRAAPELGVARSMSARSKETTPLQHVGTKGAR